MPLICFDDAEHHETARQATDEYVTAIPLDGEDSGECDRVNRRGAVTFPDQLVGQYPTLGPLGRV